MPPKKSFIPRNYKKERIDYITLCAINYSLLVDIPITFWPEKEEDKITFKTEKEELYKDFWTFQNERIEYQTHRIVRSLQILLSRQQTIEDLIKSIHTRFRFHFFVDFFLNLNSYLMKLKSI